MKIRDARAAADPPPEEVEFADDADEAKADAEPADDDEFAEEAQLAADYDEVDDTEPADQPDEVEDADEAEVVDEVEDQPDEVEVVEEVEDVEAEVPEEPELLDEDAIVLDDEQDTLPREVPAPEEAALHEVDESELLASPADWRDRWDQVQLGFVDEPLDAVENAGRLVGEVLEELARTFAARRREVEARWSEAEQISTDDLRVVFLRYREYFNRVIV